MGSNFLRPLVDPEGASLDIVAVHGLNPLSKENHAYDTWTANGKLWLRDFLPEELPQARILIFGYNANAVFDNSTAGVTDIAGTLLNWLGLRRDDCQTRPIIFIAHSLGGIIFKKALVDAQANVAFQTLDEATLGIVFFGTPHNGSDHAKLGKIAANIAKSLLRSPASSLIESLKKNSFFADELCKQFRQKLMHYWVLSFYETLPSGKIGVIVDDKSAVLGLPGPDETIVPLNSSHSDICRFSSREDDAYFQVSQNIVRLAKRVPKRYSRQKESIPPQEETGKGKEPKRLNTMPADNANSQFIGREKILEQLRDSLQFKDGEHARTALWGLGGSGKTRIARAFTRQLQMELPEIHIFWVYAATETRVRQSYADIATVANIPIPKDPRAMGRYTNLQGADDVDSARQPQTDIMQMVNSWLLSDASGRWLMILDSADSHLSLLKAFETDRSSSADTTSEKQSLAHMLPRSPMGAILVTTRNKKLALDLTAPIVKVPLMDDVEAEKLVHDKLKHPDVKQVEVHLLVNLLGYLPLALVQAAAYIQKTSITIRKYINLYEKDERTQMCLLEQDFSDLERDQNAENAVLKTWILSFEQVRSENPQAASLLSYMSFLDAQNIPESLLEVMIPDSLGLVESLATLKAFALVTSSEDNETYDMHRMIQSSMQRWLETSQESAAWADRAVGMLEIAYDKCSGNTWDNKRDEYCSHTIAALESNLRTTLASLESRARLWEEAGLTMSLNCQSDKAYDFLKKAIKLKTDLLGDTHPDTLSTIVMASRNLHAQAYRGDHYTQEAKALLLRAIHGFETVVGPQAEETISAKIFLAQLYTDSKDWTKAKEILTLILRQSKHTSWCREKMAAIIIESKQAMAHIHLKERDFRAAETLQLEVVAFHERAFTREDMKTQYALEGLASIYAGLGQLDKAKIIFEGVISTSRRLHGKTSPTIIPVIQKLAVVYCRLKCYEDALRVLEEHLPLAQEILDYDHPLRINIIEIIEQIARSLEGLHKYDEEVNYASKY